MLTISKPLSAGQAQTYHQKEFAAKEQNYWSQQGIIASEWQGPAGVSPVAISQYHTTRIGIGRWE